MEYMESQMQVQLEGSMKMEEEFHRLAKLADDNRAEVLKIRAERDKALAGLAQILTMTKANGCVTKEIHRVAKETIDNL